MVRKLEEGASWNNHQSADVHGRQEQKRFELVFSKFRMVFRFWYKLVQVVLKKKAIKWVSRTILIVIM